MSCEHDWVERGSGPGFRWQECFLCGDMTDWLPVEVSYGAAEAIRRLRLP